MTPAERNHVDLFVQRVCSLRPLWRISYEREGGFVLFSVHTKSEGTLSTPLPLTLDRIMFDQRAAISALVRAGDQRQAAKSRA